MTVEEMNESVALGHWNADQLLAKAQRHADSMASFAKDDWEYGLRSAFVMELLARSALSNISPTLLADPKDWHNLVYALGRAPTKQQFSPTSLGTTAVLGRLQELLPDFTPELKNHCLAHITRRNEELHSGGIPFDGQDSGVWLPKYFRACNVLLASMNYGLDYLFGKEESDAAEQMIKADNDDTAKAVLKTVDAFQKSWNAKDDEERDALTKRAAVWATRQEGHRVDCPACTSTALLSGSPISAPVKRISGDEITETQEFLPTKFECIACGLKLSGLSHLAACGLGGPYKATFTYDASEYYALEVDPMDFYEPDYNEP